jgi:lysophospholipid acyltransferase (LPLAT)-like uncharacterized protein
MTTDSESGRFWREIQGTALYGYTRLASLTARMRLYDTANVEAAQSSGQPVIWAMWHQQVMSFMLYADRTLEKERFSVITVGDKRGDILATMARWFGTVPHRVDMEGNPVVAGRKVLAIIKALKGGRQSLLAPDGPDGPAFRPKRGIVVLAQKSEAAVIPVGAWTPHAYQMPRWDRYLVPLPFARLHVVFGKPILAQRREEEGQLLDRIATALDRVRADARARALQQRK